MAVTSLRSARFPANLFVVVAIATYCGLSPMAFGQEASNEIETERIETDRHDFTQSTKTVGHGRAQLEFGYTYFYSDRNEEIEHAHTGPEALFRFGITERTELRLRSNYVWVFEEEERREGSEDIRFALKTETSEAEGLTPESALELRFTFPTGGDPWSTEEIEFGLDFIYGWPFAEAMELYGSTGYSTTGLGEFGLVGEIPSEDRFNTWTQSVALGVELGPVTTIYSEFFGIFTDGRSEDLELAFFNVGLDYYLSDDFVLDFRVGLGLTSESEDFFAGIGGGYRF